MAIAASGRSRRIALRAPPSMIETADPVAFGDDRRRSRGLAEGGQLADVVARLVAADQLARCRPLDVDDPDGPFDDDDQAVAGIAFAYQRVVGRVEMLLGGHRDPLEVLGIEALEQRDAPEEEHRLEITQRPARSWHLGVLRQDLARPGERSRPSSSSASRRTTASASCGSWPSSSSSRTSAPDSPRSPTESSASIAWARTSGSSERSDRRMTPPASGVPRTTSASSARPTMAASRSADRVDEESHHRPLASRRAAPSSRRERQAGAPQVRGPLEACPGPGDQWSADVRAVTTQRDERGLLRPHGAPVEDVEQPGRDVVEPGEGHRRGTTDVTRLVVERGDQVRAPSPRGRSTRRARRRRPRGRRADGAARRAADGLDRHRIADPPDRTRARRCKPPHPGRPGGP